MGQREQLLAGARRCLDEIGYARTTARDIVAAANGHLASIGYYFGSKEALLNAALLEALDEWGEKAVQQADPADAAGTPAERLTAMWQQVVESHETDRPMLVASTEAFAQAERTPAIRAQIAAAYERSRTRMAAELHGVDPEVDQR
ncbi:TetR/AcrR family transcriptional regulator, partial [Marinitenerispora sediminis]